ncbi:MAG TPA: S41 family peptidase [Gammaproteobacteria bacterium]
MSLRARSIAVLVAGTVLGLAVSLGGNLLNDLRAERGAHRTRDVTSEHAALIAEVIDRVRREYVDQVDDRRLVENAIRGILDGLDPHSRYLDPAQYEEILISTTGNYTGVGLDVTVDDGKLTVVAPLDGAPAERAGILPGDIVVSVDDVPVNESNVEETVTRMRGTPGTPVVLDVVRPGVDRPLRFALTRAPILVKSVRAEYLGNGVGYLRVSSFSESTGEELAAAAKDLRRQSERGTLRGVVLDLRNNPGGVLDAAVAVADVFLDRGLIVRGNGRSRQARFERYASPGDELEGVALAVLVNGGSASASEIVAGALQDHARARLVGERTYGKGSVQTVMPLGQGSALKLTTSLYITPAGRSINGTGIQPDVLVPTPGPQGMFRGVEGGVEPEEDPQLLEALRIVGYEEAISLSRVH